MHPPNGWSIVRGMGPPQYYQTVSLLLARLRRQLLRNVKQTLNSYYNTNFLSLNFMYAHTIHIVLEILLFLLHFVIIYASFVHISDELMHNVLPEAITSFFPKQFCYFW